MKQQQPRALVLRAPGINCDQETAHACRLAGFATDLVHINQLIQEPERLLSYQFLVLPGGFSYGDDLGAGTLLAKNLTTHLGKQLRRFVADGRPVLGICNGFQVLVRAGLLPQLEVSNESGPGASLTTNAHAQFECRWIAVSAPDGPCIFTHGLSETFELPVAHGEGQFVLAEPDQLAQLRSRGQIALVYQGSDYPANPNGSLGNIAGVCDRQGTVLGLMPHPERYVSALQHPERLGNSSDEGLGLRIFTNAYRYALTLLPSEPRVGASYAESGVDLSVAERAKELMRAAVRSSQGPRVLAGMGAFAGVFDAHDLREMRRPALVASTDGVGTKTLIASQARRYETIGADLVNHSINDLLTQGARPLFFMDYLAMGRLDAVQAALIVEGVARACEDADCALLGGETAEMPDVYLPNAFDLAGTIVGVVDVDAAQAGPPQVGDLLLGLPSSGLHTNGYSLARKVFEPYALDTIFPELGEPLVDALLRPHRSYLHELQSLRACEGVTLRALAHITGGGFEGNISRVLPAGIQAVIETEGWSVPPLFQLLARLGQVAHRELYRTLNMGVGMVLIVAPESADEVRRLLPETLTVGYLQAGAGVILH